jgi:hypothetical protein
MNIINKKMAAVVLGLGVALGAQANGWDNSSPDTIDVTPSESGSTTYKFDYLGSGTFKINSTPTISPDTDIFSSFVVASYTPGPGKDFNVVVDWIVKASPPAGDVNDVTVTIVATPVGVGNIAHEATDTDFDTAEAPEPAQTVAGAMLLGCGGLVFAGRRLFKKQSA